MTQEDCSSGEASSEWKEQWATFYSSLFPSRMGLGNQHKFAVKSHVDPRDTPHPLNTDFSKAVSDEMSITVLVDFVSPQALCDWRSCKVCALPNSLCKRGGKG